LKTLEQPVKHLNSQRLWIKMADTSNCDSGTGNSEIDTVALLLPVQRAPLIPSLEAMTEDMMPDPDAQAYMTFAEGESAGEFVEMLEKLNSIAPKDSKEGMFSGIKNLYEGLPRCNCCINWVEEYPDDTKATLDDQAQRYALIVRNIKGHEGTKPMYVCSIEVQSPLLKSILKEVFDGFEGITATLKSLTFRRPFAPFFHRWERFEKAAEHQDDELVLRHIQLLHEVLKEELQEKISTYQDLVAHQVMTFDFLWTIFVPGELLYSVQDGQDVMLKLQTSNYQGNPPRSFQISCKYVDWDGYEFGFRSSSLSIESFENTKPIFGLDIYPAKFHPIFKETKTRLETRGVQFEALKGYHFKEYHGLALGLGDNNSDNNINDFYEIHWRFSKSIVRVLASSSA
jgi:hypothetical protein